MTALVMADNVDQFKVFPGEQQPVEIVHIKPAATFSATQSCQQT